jgi:hypothetical protein
MRKMNHRSKKMNLREIVEQLTEKKPDGSRLFTQTTLGERIGSNQSGVSQMKAGGAWEQHWAVFLKLLPICLEHDLIEEREERELLQRLKKTPTRST